MVPAQTQTRKRKGANKFTQTPAAPQRHKETQADLGEAKEKEAEGVRPEVRPEHAARSAVSSAEGRNPEGEVKSEEENPNAGKVSGGGAKAMSYASAVSGQTGGPEASRAAEENTKPPQGPRDRSPVRAPPPAPPPGPTFTVHIYAVLDKRFRFSQDQDTLLMCSNEGVLPLKMTHFVGLKHGDLVEASLSVEEKDFRRGDRWTYWYEVQQRNKRIPGSITRQVQIPHEQNQKELHLYEGFIAREDRRFWQNMFSWQKTKVVIMVSEAWGASARALLQRTFQTWTPSDRRSTDSLCDSLTHFKRSLGSAHTRMWFLDGSHPPVVAASELIAETLVQILKGSPEDQIPGGWGGSGPLAQGLSVFIVSRKCEVDLGGAGWTELCLRVSSETAMDQTNLDWLLGYVQAPQYMLLGLMNLCAQLKVSELVLLVPLLFRLRRPGADAGKGGPTVEEQNWSGLENVDFCRFREGIRSRPEKRTRMLSSIRTLLPSEDPQLLIGWSALVPFEDLPEFSELTAFPAEQLVHSLFYRLRRCGDHQEENARLAQTTLTRLLLQVDREQDRMMQGGHVAPAFQSAAGVLKYVCLAVRLVQCHEAAALSFRLVVKLAELLGGESSGDGGEAAKRQKLSDELEAARQRIREWRDGLLQKPLLSASKGLSYPKEMEMWDALLKADGSAPWRCGLQRDLKKRISQASEEDQVLVCCVIQKSDDGVRACFNEQLQSAVRTICQRRLEGDLMRSLTSRVEDPPEAVVSAVVVESAARFGDPVVRLLDPQSAVSQLLSRGDRATTRLGGAAGQVVRDCEAALEALVGSLLQGHVTHGHLQTCLRHREALRRLHQQHGQSEAVPVDAVLDQREKDLSAFRQRREEMETLMKMMGKVTESITVPDMSPLEKQHSADLQPVSLNQLVLVQSFDAEGRLRKSGPPQVLWYKTSMDVLKMSGQMHRLRLSSLVLSRWVAGAASLAAARRTGPAPLPVTLALVCEHIWKPLLEEFRRLGAGFEDESVTFRELDRVLVESGDRGDGELLRRELSLMAEPGARWLEPRLAQVQQYRQLRRAAAAASVTLSIAEQMKLSGNFTEIHVLRQLDEDSFQRRALGSLTSDLLRAQQSLSGVGEQQRCCLEAFLQSWALVHWVQENLPNVSDMKVYVDLASISAGENDAEMDQVACFHDAATGYAPLLYGLPPHAGLEEFLSCARPVWDAQGRDPKLPDKLRESSRLLSWLKALKETHGSVERSSLTLASDINADGVYHVGWSALCKETRCLQNMVSVTVTRGPEQRRYRLEELLELQNKLMLMSSRGAQGREQVTRFTQVFEGVQRLAAILLRMQTSGNMLFRDWLAEVRCRGQPCVTAAFRSLRGREMALGGEVTERLQALAQAMERCEGEWRSYVGEMRSRFGVLNLFTAEQLLYLSRSLHQVCLRQAPLPPQLRLLLFPIKPQCSLSDVTAAYAAAVDEDEGSDDEDGMDSTPAEQDVEAARDFMEFSSGEEEDGEEEEAADGRLLEDGGLEALWRKFKEDMPRRLEEHLDMSRLARFLSCLSVSGRRPLARSLPPALQEGRPHLVLCPGAEVFSTVLSLYMQSAEQPLPSADEVLVCREETTEEEAELFLRRALGRGDERKIYALVNPGVLGYDVGVAVGELHEALERSGDPHYRLVVVSAAEHQHRYVPSYFSGARVPAGLSVTAEAARTYLHRHFTQSPGGPVALVSPDRLSVWALASRRPAVGKSLYVDRLFEKLKQESSGANHIRIRLIEPRVDVDSLIKSLSEKLAPLREQDPVLLHIDTAGVRSGLEELLFHLLVLGCLSDSHGVLWRRNAAHLITVEVLRTHTSSPNQPEEMKLGLLDILPTIHCRPPKEVKELLASRRTQTSDPLMDEQAFGSAGVQRPYQYLRLYSSNQILDHFKYQEGSIVGDPIDCLNQFLKYCGMHDPSWAELKNFSWFLNVQLKDCENSVFCDPDFLADQLPGFKGFIVKFMILMSRDFASPSLNTSDESPTLHVDTSPEVDLLTLRKHWENQAHPYIFFNADRFSMSFLGFNVIRQGPNRLDAVDPRSGIVLMENVMSQKLFEGLERQRISLTGDFDQLPRADKIRRISLVVGAEKGIMDRTFDPDPTYELTADNVMKMLAIHMRFRCGIPVVIMGETGCGKTRLVRFLCALQREDKPVENMVLVKVHGGTTAEMIYRKVREAEVLARENRRIHQLDTILFFDEGNTTEAIFAIKEVLCDQTMKGEPLTANSGLKIIAACNPYRKHSLEMVERLERAGLGYRVKADETEDRLGKVPMRQLVYRVHPLPPSMAALVWDFGQLSDSTELSYIRQIVQKQVVDHRLPATCKDIISNVLAASQKYLRSRENECSFVSLRDVERSMKVLVWFYQHSEDLFKDCSQLSEAHIALKCLILSVGVCYYPSLVDKEQYLSVVCRYFPDPLCHSTALQEEISSCQDFFLHNIQTRETIAKNVALKENVFLMVVCIELRIPLFLVGKPGSSKSLAKTVVADAMQGQNSHCDLFKKLKQVHMVSFQCSPHSSPEGIIGTFKNCARFQKDKNMDEYVSVVVLDEIGLAEDSPQMPLKTLHPLLEDGCIDNDKPDPHMKVGFVGISNWALDPAKMNRGIFVSRWDPSEDELVETAKGICSSSKPVLLQIKHLFPSLAKAFLTICKETTKNQFFGLRDYYSLVKMLFAVVKSTRQEPDGGQLVEAILRNFSGQPEGFDPVIFFHEVLQNLTEIPRPSTLQMVKKNLDHDTDQVSRYLLLLTTNNAALHFLQRQIFAKGDYPAPEIVFGSGFPKDQEYAQICRNVNRVKTCMETGRTVILLNMQNLYESLYDALNQYYVYLSKQQYVDLGLGSHRVKCRVHTNFRLVVVEDQKKVYEHFPMPLINRLEKHRVDRSTDLEPWQLRVLHKLKAWVEEFSGEASADFKQSDIFVGYHGDACASALLQALERRAQRADDGAVEGDQPSRRLDSHPNEEGADQKDDPLGDAMDTEVAGKERGIESIDENNEMSEGEDLMEVEIAAGENEEEEIFDSAKCFLLNCVTPDAVLRLKYSDLANQEKEKLQRMYFQQQHHHSLRSFLQDGLDKHQGANRFLEITTFSSLLTRSDVRVVAPALGLQAESLLLLSLHQFDTEVSFCNKIRGFLGDAGPSLHILLIQMDPEESHCSDELIASAKYCTMNYLTSPEGQTCWVIFIVKVSRIPSKSQYIGFQGGVWRSVHIDDLRDSEDMSLNLLVYCGTLISNLLHPAEHRDDGEAARTSRDSQGDAARLHPLALVRSCIQKAVGLLRDPHGMTSRSMQRMHILLTLLGAGPVPMGARFQEVLLSRLAEALARREEMMDAPEQWVSMEARKRPALQEGGTLRHTLWRRLQSTVTPILAHMLEVMDRFASLDLLSDGRLSRGLGALWLDVLADSQILDLTPLQHQSDSDQEVAVHHHYFLLDGAEQSCSAPFSWLVRRHLESLWEESEFMPETTEDSSGRILQLVSSFSGSRLGGHLQKLPAEERRAYGLLYLRDFLLLSLKIESSDELKVFSRAVLGCVAELQSSAGDAPPELSPAWITAAAERFAPRLDCLRHAFRLQPRLAAAVHQQASEAEPREMVEDIVALAVCVEGVSLQAVTSVTSLQDCRSLVVRVEVLQPCLDRALGRKYRTLCSAGCLQHLDSIRSQWDRLLVVSSFIQNVVLRVDDDSRLRETSLKHCNLLLKLLQDSPAMSSVVSLQQLIRVLNSFHDECTSEALRPGASCPVCLAALSQPAVLPCLHVVCSPCLRLLRDRRCPQCRAELPPDFAPTVSPSVQAALRQHAAVRDRCNAFFLEVVSRFYLSEGQRPGDGVVELLFSLLVSASGDVYRTRELTPFLECVDNSPVVRSVLPKLLLQHSFQQVKTHIQTYLRNLEENLLTREDRTELYLLFVNCFQDSLLCSDARGEEPSRDETAAFLSAVAGRRTADRRRDPAEFLLDAARLRVCLSAAARLLQGAAPQGVEAEYLQQVKAACEGGANDWHRVYLLRALHRLAGVDRLLTLMSDPAWSWLFPPELLRRQRLIPTSVDPFLCCGPPYRATRDAVGRVLLEDRSDSFETQIQELSSRSQISLLPLAVFRQVTCRYRSPDLGVLPPPRRWRRCSSSWRTSGRWSSGSSAWRCCPIGSEGRSRDSASTRAFLPRDKPSWSCWSTWTPWSSAGTLCWSPFTGSPTSLRRPRSSCQRWPTTT
ncbi:E3 ubiquitin-protein ligase rnf213-beta isoform X2 [Pseudoliparis swirei]|uniref:E3 ubiquitin-protein ligase rnf213-beta isoform X2 n=1 Tax=Pseudoliparis swirei TaxID=2059687 RepID=UPI0024BE17F3|nr:E3 ubiquitin-protein ligase rnf213-beta isoform X2 [Pseudoliparis swirei]